jgi:type IV pilus assembly protein PilW
MCFSWISAMTHANSGSAAREQGHTLIELVVAAALGLVTTAALVQVYGAQREVRAYLDGRRVLQDAGERAVEFIAIHARLAGLVALDDMVEGRPPVAIAEPVRVNDASAGVAATAKHDVRSAQTGASDRVTFRYAADRVSTGTSDIRNATDCLGQSVSDSTVETEFYVQRRWATRPPELVCRGNGGGTPQPVVEGVERLQLRFWVPQRDVPVRASSLRQDDGAHATALDICVVVRGPRVSRPTRYVSCDGTSVIPDDLYLRAAITRRVALRNGAEHGAST